MYTLKHSCTLTICVYLSQQPYVVVNITPIIQMRTLAFREAVSHSVTQVEPERGIQSASAKHFPAPQRGLLSWEGNQSLCPAFTSLGKLMMRRFISGFSSHIPAVSFSSGSHYHWVVLREGIFQTGPSRDGFLIVQFVQPHWITLLKCSVFD